jgi:glyoxylase-like metal-dependent hydrolase (beta-lactamase superfamily II)
MLTPGHSAGSISLYERETGSLFPGDVFFCNGGVGRWDLPSGNYEELKESIHRLAELEIINLYPGHDVYSEGDGNAHAEMAIRSMELSPFDLMMRRT